MGIDDVTEEMVASIPSEVVSTEEMGQSDDYFILIGSSQVEFIEKTTYALRKGSYKVQVISSGKELVKTAKMSKPHLILLDVNMNEVDGIETCWELKSDVHSRILPILFISDKNEDYTQLAAYEAGADDYIIRPERSRILLAKINAWLKRCYELSSSIYQVRKFGNIEIDEEQVMVYKKGQSLKVSKKEFQLLLLLTSKPGKVFRRNNILAKIWGDDIIVGDRNIDTHIKKLRKKLGKDHIQTVRGIGYKFQY